MMPFNAKQSFPKSTALVKLNHPLTSICVQARAAINAAPFNSDEALEHKLIDDFKYR